MADTTTDNKVHYDLVDVYVAPLTIAAGVATYGVPVPLPGSISTDLGARGNAVMLRADGMVYWQTNSNDGYEGSLNLALVPDWFRQQYLGEILDETDKVQVETAEADPQPFALLYGFKGDKSRRRHVLYSCMASRPNIKGENKENQKNPDTESFNLSAVPLPNGHVKASTTANTPDTVYKGWTTAVWQKAAAAEG